MTTTTKAELVELVEAQKELISALEKKNKSAKKSTSKKIAQDSGKITFSDTWQLLTGKAFSGNQINLPPMPKDNSKYTQNIIGKFAVPCTKAGLDMARAEIDIAENKLEKSGLLTA